MIFINTRPTDRGQTLTQALQDRGLTVLELPLLELVAINISEREQRYQNTLTQCTAKQNQTTSVPINSDLTQYDALVVVSPSAAQLGLAACPINFVPSCPVIAVGSATAKILQNAGWLVQMPNESSNEGMMKMDELASLGNGNKVLIWRGRGGRRLLVNHLKDKGIVVDAIAWYERRCPDDLVSNFSSIKPQLLGSNKSTSSDSYSAKPTVLISSGVAFSHWRSLISDTSALQLNDFDYLTFGKRLTDTVSELHLRCKRIDNLEVDEVWQGMQQLMLRKPSLINRLLS